ncbi:MAG TPA: hypothetical protein PLO37_06175 [Candidatus Hydrogenedentes bacterium]|nr:hypothetical protein [Candidatus Hydrogenedentota bacterium]HPG66417.1 hypothetical protein [Candidatus Hydrogenedentota bacterium]
MTTTRRKALTLGLLLALGWVLCGTCAVAADSEPAEAAIEKEDLTMAQAIRAAGLAVAAGITMAGAALATGKVQAAVGAGGTGVLAEKPEMFTLIIILIAIPETLVILGFVLAYVMLGQM